MAEIKTGDLIYWHEDAWLMKAGVPPTVRHAIAMREHEESKPHGKIWHVLVLETGLPGIVHETPNIRVKVSSDV